MYKKIWGKVKKGKGRGKRLGFPTANINLHKNIPQGIYLSKTRINKKYYPSLTFVGKARTFNESNFQAETYILSFNKKLYNQWISIHLLKKIRSNKKFKTSADLIRQMQNDRKAAREFFNV